MEAVHCPWTRKPFVIGPCPRYETHGDCAACPYNEAVRKKAAPEGQPAKPPGERPKRRPLDRKRV